MKIYSFLFAFIVVSLSYAQKPTFTVAKTQSATVYSNAAELFQTTQVTLPSGQTEIVVKNIADYMLENTLRIGAGKEVTVLSAQFTKNYVSEYEIDEGNPVIKKVKDSIKVLTFKIKQAKIQQVNLLKTIELLDKNQQVAGQNGSATVAELMKLVDYYKQQRLKLDKEVFNSQEDELKWNEELNKLNARLQVNNGKEDEVSQGKLVLQVMVKQKGNYKLDINYLTNNASWQPFYDLRAKSVTEPLDLTYKAKIIQNTGVNWKNVKLSLSNGVPNQNNQIPTLQTWFLRFGYSQTAINQAMMNRNYGVSTKEKKNEDLMEEATVSNYTTITENQMSVSFDIDVPYTILSNGKAHSVAMKEIKMPVDYHYYTAPRLDKEAYLIAQIKDYAKYNMLSGEANIIFEDMYVGKTYLDTNSISDTLELAMGRDKKISVKREKVVDQSGTKFLSNYKEQTFTYEITVRNNKNTGIEITVKDQYPISTDEEIEVTLLDKSGAKINKEIGTLTWNLKLKPNESKKLRMSYKVRYPKNKHINF